MKSTSLEKPGKTAKAEKERDKDKTKDKVKPAKLKADKDKLEKPEGEKAEKAKSGKAEKVDKADKADKADRVEKTKSSAILPPTAATSAKPATPSAPASAAVPVLAPAPTPSAAPTASANPPTPATAALTSSTQERPMAVPLSPRGFGADVRQIIKLIIDDLPLMKVDALISPANNESLLNTTVANKIAIVAGRELSKECNKIGKIALGEAVITPAGKLKAKYVIHAACMDYGQTSNEEVLVQAMRNALLRAKEHNIKTLALPPLDASGKQFPLKRCAELMISEVIRHAEKEATLEEVLFVLDSDRTRRIFEECLRQV